MKLFDAVVYGASILALYLTDITLSIHVRVYILCQHSSS